MPGLLRLRLRCSVVALVLLAPAVGCGPDPDIQFLEKLLNLQGATDDAKALEATADLVRFARQHDIKYRCEMRLTGSEKIVPPGELARHLNDDIEVMLHVDTRTGYSETRWNPPSNVYLAQLAAGGRGP